MLTARNLLAGHGRSNSLKHALATLRVIYSVRTDAVPRGAALASLEAWTGRSGRGFVIDSFWSAWDAFAGAANYQETIERAIRYGRDTDTTACIAGGLAGIHWGIAGIPADWLSGMRGKSIVAPLIGRLQPDPDASPSGSVPPNPRTSKNNPIRIAWIDPADVPTDARWTGELGMTFLPGKHDLGIAGQHWRDVQLDVARLKELLEVDTFVLLVEDHELQTTSTTDIDEVMAQHGIDLVRFPIVDGDVPADLAAFRSLLDETSRKLRVGRKVVVACRGGLGRTGTVVACLLREANLTGELAIEAARRSRPGAIENAPQEAFVRAWMRTASR